MGHLNTKELSHHQDAYQNSTIKHKLARQRGTPYTLFTDIDGTWIRLIKELTFKPDDLEKLSPEDLLARSIKRENMNRFHELATRKNKTFLDSRGVPIVAISGRDYTSFVNLLTDLGSSVEFDIFVGSQGGEIYVRQLDDTYLPDLEQLELVKQFDKLKIHAACAKFIALHNHAEKLSFMPQDSQANIALYSVFPEAKTAGLTMLDPPPKLKVLCSLQGTAGEAEVISQGLKNWLITAKFPLFDIVLDGTNGQLDHWDIEIVPMNKKTVVNYLTQKLNCHGVVAGNGGNDLDALKHGAHAGVVVGGEFPYLYKELSSHIIKSYTRSGLSRLSLGDQVDRVIFLSPERGENFYGPSSIDVERLYHTFMLLRSLITH